MKNNALNNILKSILAGGMISIGATVYLSCSNKIVGALLFSIGLISICLLNMNLFTGKIGFISSVGELVDCIITWIGNILGCLCFSLTIRAGKPQLCDAANTMVQSKLSTNLVSIAVSAFFCGVLMYIAVRVYKENKNIVGIITIIMCVSVFIICGFEHSIADICYFIIGIKTTNEVITSIFFILMVSICNGFGSLTISNMLRLSDKLLNHKE